MSKLRSIVAVVACSLAITFVAPALSVLVLPVVLSAAPAWVQRGNSCACSWNRRQS